MIFILVNNDYHVRDFISYFGKDIANKSCFITIPVNLTESIIPSKNIVKIPCFSFRKNFFNFKKTKQISNWVYNNITFETNDILFVFSECELSNQVVISEFRKKASKIFLIEDGTSTPVTFNTKPDKSLLSVFLKFYLRYFIGLKDVIIRREGRAYLYSMPDSFFQGLIVFSQYRIQRKLTKYTIPLIVEQGELFSGDTNNCIFFHQSLQIAYIKIDDYIQVIDNLLNKITDSFDTVYFKFHPSEQKDVIAHIKNMCAENLKIVFLDQCNTHEYLSMIPATFAISFHSTALREYEILGLKPIYLFHLYKDISSNAFNHNMLAYLDNKGYIFLESLEKLNDYCKLPSFYDKDRLQVNPDTLFNISNFYE